MPELAESTMCMCYWTEGRLQFALSMTTLSSDLVWFQRVAHSSDSMSQRSLFHFQELLSAISGCYIVFYHKHVIVRVHCCF